MIITTTNSIEGYEIEEYLGIVAGEVVAGINMFRDIGAGLRNMFGGRSAGYEDEMQQARNECIAEMGQRAEALGAKCDRRRVVGLRDVRGHDHDRRLRHRRAHSPGAYTALMIGSPALRRRRFSAAMRAMLSSTVYR